MREERPPRDVLAEGDPVNLLEYGDQGTRWGVGDDLVSKPGCADGLGDPSDERRVEDPGDLGELSGLR